MVLSPLLELPSSCSRETLVGNAGSLKEERRVAHAPYAVLCVQRADRTNVHCHRHDASCSPNRVCSKRAHRVLASHPLRMRKALARLMSCSLLASSRALWIRTLKARGFSTPCFPSPHQDARRGSRWTLVTICRGQWTKVTLCFTLSSAWTYAMRLQCAAIECDGLMCLAKQKIVSSSLDLLPS